MAKQSKPVQKFRIGLVECAIWNNESFYSVTFSRSYKDGEEWKNTDSFGEGDLQNVSELARRASAWIAQDK